MCNATPVHTCIHHTFAIFNMVPVYPGLGSSYGLRIIHTSRAVILIGIKRQADDTFGTWRVHYLAGACSQHTNTAVKTSYLIDYKCDIVHKDEYTYKTVSLSIISVTMNAPSGLTGLRNFFRMQISGSYITICEENVVFDRRDGCDTVCFFSHLTNRNKNIRDKWKNIVCCWIK